jgi:hypothetical protein
MQQVISRNQLQLAWAMFLFASWYLQEPTRNGYGKVCMENGGELLFSIIHWHISSKALHARVKNLLYHYQIFLIKDGDE